MKPALLFVTAAFLAMFFLVTACGDDSGNTPSPDQTCTDTCAKMISVCPDEFDDAESCQTNCLDSIASMEATSVDAQIACLDAADSCDSISSCIENIPTDGVDPDCISACEKLTGICPEGFGSMGDCLPVCNEMLAEMDDQEKDATGACIDDVTDCASGYECVGMEESPEPSNPTEID